MVVGKGENVRPSISKGKNWLDKCGEHPWSDKSLACLGIQNKLNKSNTQTVKKVQRAFVTANICVSMYPTISRLSLGRATVTTFPNPLIGRRLLLSRACFEQKLLIETNFLIEGQTKTISFCTEWISGSNLHQKECADNVKVLRMYLNWWGVTFFFFATI